MFGTYVCATIVAAAAAAEDVFLHFALLLNGARLKLFTFSFALLPRIDRTIEWKLLRAISVRRSLCPPFIIIFTQKVAASGMVTVRQTAKRRCIENNRFTLSPLRFSCNNILWTHRIYAFNSRFFPSLLLLSPFFIAVNKIPLIWRSQRHNEINDRMDSAWRYIPIGRQLGECMGWHLQQPILARDAAEQWLRDTASHVSSKCCPSIFTHKAHREWDENVIWIEIMQTVFASAHLHSALFFMLKLGYGAIARARLRCDCGLQPTRTLKFSSTSNTNAIE